MPQGTFLSEILRRVARSGRIGRDRPDEAAPDLVALCTKLMANPGEASELVTAQVILTRYANLTRPEKTAFFQSICDNFGVDDVALTRAIKAWSPGDVTAAREVHFAAEPRSQAMIRHLNRVPGATAQLVGMRADLLEIIDSAPEFRGLDKDFLHLFGSWFNRGFLEIRRINWSTPAEILEKIITYEAVHEFTGWDDLRQRVGAADRRLFAFFHPAMPAEPLIFVAVALTKDIPSAIRPILGKESEPIEPELAKTAVFYSISNCQRGLRGISFGNFLIKQVVVELQQELPNLTTFVTLSPVPGLRNWVNEAVRNNDPLLKPEVRAILQEIGDDRAPGPQFTARLAALYLTRAKRKTDAYDPVAHFHLGNGAQLFRVHASADPSPSGQDISWGVMVNYLYDGQKTEARHQAYATERTIAISAEVEALAKDQKDLSHV